LSAAAEEDEEVDELLAALGHKVHSSDMGDLAQKLEQLEMAMGMAASVPRTTPSPRTWPETKHFTTHNFLHVCACMVDFYGAYGAGGRAKCGVFLCFSFLHESVLC
jgi:hypothetical protein